MTNEVQKHGFACAQGDCLRNAFLITMGWNYAGFLPQRKEGYSLGMLASRLADAGFEFECVYATQHPNVAGVNNAFWTLKNYALSVHESAPNVVFCVGLNCKKQPHAWALIQDTSNDKIYLVDAQKMGVEELDENDLMQVFARTFQLAIIAKDGKFTPNTGANFVRNLGNLPVLFSQ